MGGQRSDPARAVRTLLGDRLRALRQAAGLTQEELAERAGLTAHAVSALERGTRTRPHPHTLRSLARALDTSDRDLALLRAAVARPESVSADVASAIGAPAVTTAGSRPSTALPDPPTALVGRAREIATLAEMLRRADTPLVTLTGPGGVGKTRLAVAVARALADDFPDGASFVPLAALSAPALVMSAVGRALGLADLDSVDAQAAVAEHLRPLRHLLVLDNFEHLTAAAPQLVELAAACPGLAVLVTTRAALRVRGENEFPVQPLALPAASRPGVAAVLASPAGALFLARAQAVQPGFAVTDDNVGAVTAVCRRLAGIPLALELAAARLRYLEPGVLLARLDDAMAREGARDLPARQRTMRATIDWSYQLLDPAEQQLFRRLSVFTGGFTLDAAEYVGSCRLVDGPQVLGLLESLVEQSLVAVHQHDGHLRYGMLEPIGQYARDLLERAGEAAEADAAHAEFYLRLAERAAPGYQRSEQLEWLARMDPETANTALAVERSLDHGDVVAAGRMCWALWLFWWLRGHLLLGRRLSEATLAHERLPDTARARVLAAAGAMAFALGDNTAAGRLWRRAFDLGEAVGDRIAAAHTLPGVGIVALADGDLATAETTLTRAVALTADAGADGEWPGDLTRIWLGTVRMLGGDPVGAVSCVERGLASARRRGDRLTSYIALYNLSQAALAQGDHDRARTYLVEGIELSRQTRDAANLAYFFELLAVATTRDGHAPYVATLLGAAQSMRELAGAEVYGYYRPDQALTEAAAGRACEALGADGYDDHVDAGRALDLDAAVAFALAVPITAGSSR